MADFTITTSPVNTKTWLSQQNLYVCGYTRIRVQSTPAPGSSFSSYDVAVGSTHYSGADITSFVWPASSVDVNPYVAVTASGSSGNVRKVASVTMLGYTKPMLTTFVAERGTYTSGTWTADPEGAHIRVEAVPSVSLTTQGNTATVTVKIGATNPDATSGNYYYFTSTSASSSYTVTGTAQDLLLESTTRTLSVASAGVPFNVDVDIPGAAFGKVAEKTKVVEVAPDWSLQANGKYNTAQYVPYSFRTNGGSATVGWARIARITATGTFVANVGFPKLVFTVQSRTLTKATLQMGFNGPTLLGNLDIDVTVNNWLCNPARTDNVPFVQTISTSATMGVYDVYFPKGYAEDDLTVYTQCSSELQDLITIEYSENLLTSKPGSNVNDFKLAAVPIMTVSNRMGFGSSANPDLYQVKLADTWSLVANGKNNTFAYMPNSFQTGYSNGNLGYLKVATFTFSEYYNGSPISIVCKRILDNRPVTLYLSFPHTATADPTSCTLLYDSLSGTATTYPFVAFAIRESTSTWGVYVNKCGTADIIDVTVYMPYYLQTRCTVSYIEARYPSVPSGAVMAKQLGALQYQYDIFNNTQSLVFSIANGATRKLSGITTGECAWLLSCTGWAQNIRSGLWYIAGYNDSSRADVTTLKAASAISISAVSSELAWNITNTGGQNALFTCTVLYGAMPTIT